jgi:cytochrome c-type biogenesis protein
MESLVSSGPLLVALGLALAAGIVSFISPCVLPLAPGYLTYITGLTAADASSGVGPSRRLVVVGTTLFTLGFAVVFVSYGVLFGGVGAALLTWQDPITRVMGLVVVALGLGYVLDARVLNRSWRLPVQAPRGLWGAPLLGLVFGIGWAPCIGPVLAVVQAMAFTQADAVRGATLSAAYCIGLGLPFLLVGLGLQRAMSAIGWARANTVPIRRVSGYLMIALGVVMASGAWNAVTVWMRVQAGAFATPI